MVAVLLLNSQVYTFTKKRIMAIQCLRSPSPVFFHRDIEEVFFIRTGNGTQQLKPSEVLAYLDQRKTESE